MTAISVTLKPGILHLSTPSGGVLMDLQADVFVALSPLSSAIWESFSTNGAEAAVERIMSDAGRSLHEATLIFARQVQRWQHCGLTQWQSQPTTTLTSKPLGDTTTRELAMETVRREAFNVVVAAELFVTERRYRRLLSTHGLASALLCLQREEGLAKGDSAAIVRGVVKNYHALRRLFRQGAMARDCLHRSLALTAVLRRRAVDADLCIGVVDLPFGSHAWVEAQDLILNESAEKRARYTLMARF